MRIKKKAVLLSMVVGAFGVHRFYLGQKFKGALYLLFGFSTFGAFIETGSGFFMFMVFIGVIDAILLMAQSQKSFDDKFNQGTSTVNKGSRRQRSFKKKQRVNPVTPIQKNKVNPRSQAKNIILEGVALFKSFDYSDAIDKFNEALKIDPNNPNIYFNLACAYSLVEMTDKAYIHLDKAVDLGFNKYDRILEHDALAFIRTKDRFEDFKGNGYRLNKQLAPPTSILDMDESTPDTSKLLGQLQELAKQRRHGDLTQEEFLEKKRMLVQK